MEANKIKARRSLWHRCLYEVREQSRTSLPSMLGMLLYKVPWLLSLAFVGRLGSMELAAAALATTLCNVTGMSLSVGLSSAMSTLTGQSRGDLMAKLQRDTGKEQETEQEHDEEKKSSDEQMLLSNDDNTLECGSAKEASRLRESPHAPQELPLLPLVILIRGSFVQLLLVLPVGMWWLYGIKPLLLALCQGEELSDMTQQYLRILAPGLWSYSINWTLTSWLQALEMADIPMYAAFVGMILHVPFNVLLIYGLSWGYLGAAVATVMFQLIQPILMLTYVFGTKHGVARVLESTIASAIKRTRLSFWEEARLAMMSVAGIRQYLALALPGIIIISEWWASELCIFLSGRMTPSPALALDGMTIYQSINTFCFMFPMGVSIAGSARVGSFLGAGDVVCADFSAKVSVASAALLSTLMGSILYLTPHTFFPSFFSPDANVVLEASKTIPLLSVYVFADGVQTALNGIIKGCGRQCITVPVVVVAYWIVGLPLAYYLAFVRNDANMACSSDGLCGIPALVAGLTTGTWVHMMLLVFIVAFTTNWKVQASRAIEMLSHDKEAGYDLSLSPML